MTLPKEAAMLRSVELAIRQAVFETYGHIHVNGGYELATAALTALREPTPEMIAAGMKCADISLSAEFTAMTDAALTKGEG